MKNLRCRLLLVFAGILCAAPIQAQLKSTKVPRFDAAVAKAVGYLEADGKQINPEDLSLAAYALLKAGVPKTHPTVASGIAAASKRGITQGYQGYKYIYMAGVDAMLLADSDPKKYQGALQQIADFISSAQRRDGSWAENLKSAGDVSMSQYGALGLWAAARADCSVSPQVLDNAASFFLRGRNRDSGWPYKPGTTEGPGNGKSTYNMTMAGTGCLAIIRDLFYGPREKAKKKEELIAGILKREEIAAEESGPKPAKFADYKATNAKGTLDTAVDRGVTWNRSRFSAVPGQEHRIYFFYCLERAAAMAQMQDGWFETYGDGLLTLQGKSGAFNTHSGEDVGTSFAILYFMRSTQQIIDQTYPPGQMAGGRLEDLRKKEKTKEIGPLDELLAQMENANFDELDGIDAEAVAEKIAFGSREELIGQMDLLKKLVKHKDASNRRAAYFALGRTGDYSLIPQMLKGLRDPNVDVNVEALRALKYISRKPNGFGLSERPFDGVEGEDDETKLKAANAWRTKAYKTWGNWFRTIRPYEDTGGLDELELKSGQLQK